MSDNAKPAPGQPTPQRAPENGPASYLAAEHKKWNALLAAQPGLIQRFFENQARLLADAVVQSNSQVSFAFPDQVFVREATGPGSGRAATVPPGMRDQLVGGLLDRLTRTSLAIALRDRLNELEGSSDPSVATSAGLIRFATAIQLVHNLLPAGRTLQYRAREGEEIPSIPVEDPLEPASAITARTDAIVEGPDGDTEEGRGEVQVPYVPAARKFYLPQWIAFDERYQLLVGSLNEADAHLASMQRFIRVLHNAVSLAPYMVADEQYQRKRYGMLGQLVNQGRALARYQTRQIIETIQRRAAASDLNRGLGLSLPYFDDQALEMKTYDFQVIPAGRIMFVPAMVLRACLQEEVKVAQDTRLSPSTRKYLLAEFEMLEVAFEEFSD
jgi:hypothetical protein